MPDTTPITSKTNPTIKRYIKLSTMKKYRISEGCFVIEGVRLVREALQEHVPIDTLLITERLLPDFSFDETEGISRFVVSEQLAEHISSTEMPQGVFAICSQNTSTPELSENGRYVFLNGLQDSGNVGMIIRTADALGFDGVITAACCDLYSPKTIRATMGSLFRVPIYTSASPDDMLRQLREFGLTVFAAVADSSAESVREISFSKGFAIAVGNEGNGLPEDFANACDRRITIPMSGRTESLNAAMAAGILMWCAGA